MKQKLKKILKLFTICTIIALSSCEKDLYNDAIHEKNHNKFKITEKTFDELMLDKKFKNAYNKIIETNNSNASKTIMEVNYNFTISELPAKF